TMATTATAIAIRVVFLLKIPRCPIVGRCPEVYTRAPRRTSMRWTSAAAIAVLTSAALLATATPLRAQAVQTSTLTGTIKAGTGAVLPGVTVNASSPAQVGGVQTSVTDSQGVYRFPALHPGIYELEASLSGFKSVKRGEITLTLGTTTTIDVTLSVASV